MTDHPARARHAAVAIEARGWVNGVPQLLRSLADHVERLQRVARAGDVMQFETDRLHAEVARLKGAIKSAEADSWREHGEPLSALCIEAAGRVDDGEQVDGLSELLRAARKSGVAWATDTSLCVSCPPFRRPDWNLSRCQPRCSHISRRWCRGLCAAAARPSSQTPAWARAACRSRGPTQCAGTRSDRS